MFACISSEILIDTFFFTQCAFRDGFVEAITVFDGNTSPNVVQGKFKAVGGDGLFSFTEENYFDRNGYYAEEKFASYPGVAIDKDKAIEGVSLPPSFFSSNFAIVFYADIHNQNAFDTPDIYEDKVIKLLNIGDVIVVSEVFVTHFYAGYVNIDIEVFGTSFRVSHTIRKVGTYILYQYIENGHNKLVLCAISTYDSFYEVLCTRLGTIPKINESQSFTLLDGRNATNFEHPILGLQQGRVDGRRIVNSISFLTFNNADIPFSLDFNDYYYYGSDGSSVIAEFILASAGEYYDTVPVGDARQGSFDGPNVFENLQELPLLDFTHYEEGNLVKLTTFTNKLNISISTEYNILFEVKAGIEDFFDFHIELTTIGCKTQGNVSVRVDLKPDMPYFVNSRKTVRVFPNEEVVFYLPVKDEDHFFGYPEKPKVVASPDTNLSYGKLTQLRSSSGEACFMYTADENISTNIEFLDEIHFILSDDILPGTTMSTVTIKNKFFQRPPTSYPTRFVSQSPTKFPTEAVILKSVTQLPKLMLGSIFGLISVIIVTLTCFVMQIAGFKSGHIVLQH